VIAPSVLGHRNTLEIVQRDVTAVAVLECDDVLAWDPAAGLLPDLMVQQGPHLFVPTAFVRAGLPFAHLDPKVTLVIGQDRPDGFPVREGRAGHLALLELGLLHAAAPDAVAGAAQTLVGRDVALAEFVGPADTLALLNPDAGGQVLWRFVETELRRGSADAALSAP